MLKVNILTGIIHPSFIISKLPHSEKIGKINHSD